MSALHEDVLVRARSFAEPFLSGESLDTGENILAHADAAPRAESHLCQSRGWKKRWSGLRPVPGRGKRR
jgi:hypothetical protein